MRSRVDAMIIISFPPSKNEFASLMKMGKPIAVVGFHHEACASVAIDDFAAAREATQHLVELGHKRIGLISGQVNDPLGFEVVRNRREGFLQVLEEAGISWHPRLEVYGDFTMRGASLGMAELLSRGAAPTAIFALSDEMALGALQTIRRRGLRVPEDISMIGFDDHEMAEFSDLSTVRQPVSKLGEIAAHAVIERLHSPESSLPHVTLETELIIRNSTSLLGAN